MESSLDPGNRFCVPPALDLVDKSKILIVVDLPSGYNYQSPPGSPSKPSSSQSQPCAPLLQPSLDTSSAFLQEEELAPSSTQLSTPSDFGLVQSTSTQDISSVVAAPLTPSTPLNISFPVSVPSTPTSSSSLSCSAVLLALYYSHPSEVDAAYNAMKPDEPITINKVDVHGFFGHSVRKVALFVLKNDRRNEMELIAAAKSVCKKSLVELLVNAYPNYQCSTNACNPAIHFLAQATGNSWFQNLKTTNGTNLIMNAFRQRRKRFNESVNPRNPTTPSKKRKVIEPPAPEVLDAASIALSRSTSAAETKKLVSETSIIRCSWIKFMERENALQIPETFMQKFPCFVSDASLLHEDYQCNMQQIRGIPAAAFGESFKKYIPAIFNLAAAKNILPSNYPMPTEADVDEYLGCKIMIQLVPKYCKRNSSCKPERLLAESWDSTHLPVLNQIRRDIKQTAPMIFVATNYPSSSRTYFVATDDFALKVKGSFCNALQTLMELHYIFDLAYAKEMKPFFLLLEALANVTSKKLHATLNDFYMDLIDKADSINDENHHPLNFPAACSTLNTINAPSQVVSPVGPSQCPPRLPPPDE